LSVREIIKENAHLSSMFETVPEYILQRCFIKRFEKRTMILNKDDEINDIYFVCEGSIRVISEFVNGTIHGFAYVEPGDIIGAMELLSEHRVSACSLETVTDSVVISMAITDFMEWFELDHSFSKAVARMVARKFFPTSYDYGVVFKEEAVKTVGRYLYKYALNESKVQGNIEIDMTRQYLGEELGVSTRTVYRALKKLNQLGCISIINGEMILSPKNLSSLRDWIDDK